MWTVECCVASANRAVRIARSNGTGAADFFEKGACKPPGFTYYPGPPLLPGRRIERAGGRSSGVEHNLAKVGVEGSNPFARSSSVTSLPSEAGAIPNLRGGRKRAGGRSSGVEHNLAKVGVEGSNPFARSKFQHIAKVLREIRR